MEPHASSLGPSFPPSRLGPARYSTEDALDIPDPGARKSLIHSPHPSHHPISISVCACLPTYRLPSFIPPYPFKLPRLHLSHNPSQRCIVDGLWTLLISHAEHPDHRDSHGSTPLQLSTATPSSTSYPSLVSGRLHPRRRPSQQYGTSFNECSFLFHLPMNQGPLINSSIWQASTARALSAIV